MPTLKQARIALYPANKTSFVGSVTIKFCLGEKMPETLAEFTTLPTLQTKVEAFVNEHAADEAFAYGCYASVSMPRGARKPAGFDRWHDDHRYFNLKQKPEDDV
jgi:hypothetical protein